MNAVDRLIRPVGLQELHDIVKIWVDCALRLDTRSMEWMQRLYQRQLAIFGTPLQLAAIRPRRAIRPHRRRCMTGRRVAITGIGVVSPHGCDADVMFDSLMRGESAVRKFPLASSVGSYERSAPRSKTIRSRAPARPRVASDRVSQLRFWPPAPPWATPGSTWNGRPTRVGCAIGTSLGGTISQEAAYEEISPRARPVLPFTLVKVMYNGPAAYIGIAHGLAGPTLTYTTTCSSLAVSIGEAMRQIRHGYADVMLAGGAEAPFAYVSIKAWQALQVLAPERAGDPAATCRPFSRDRDGTVLGDGAAIVVLEDWSVRSGVARGSTRSSLGTASATMPRT